jgi:predicted enzyme related to lactoylglutathione lyase
MVISSIDNVFFNTKDVRSLTSFYSSVLGLPVSRLTEIPCGSGRDDKFVIWGEIPVGGVQLSFRKAGGTESVHPEFSNFQESCPGSGATIAFGVQDMGYVREKLLHRGMRFHGDVFSCTDGRELISVFEDPWGRLLQLYEPRFNSDEIEAYYPQAQQCAAPAESGTYTSMQLTLYQHDLSGVLSFYSEVLDIPVTSVADDRICFELGQTQIEFRTPLPSHRLPKGSPSCHVGGTVPVFLAKDFRSAKQNLELIGTTFCLTPMTDNLNLGMSICFSDPDGNMAEIRSF